MPRQSNPRWDNNEVQFARLLCEIVSTLDEGQTKDLIIDLCRSMDLGPDEVNQLFDRAEEVWEGAKYEVAQDRVFANAFKKEKA